MQFFNTAQRVKLDKQTEITIYYHFDYDEYRNGHYSEGYFSYKNDGFGPVVINQEDLTFPLDIYPDNIKNYLLECNRTLNSSIDYMGCSMLWLMSIIIGNTVKCEVKKGWIESVNIWLAIVGKAGVGKSHNLDIITYPLNFLNNLEIKKYAKNCQRFNEYNALTKKEKAETEHIDQPIKSQFIVSDISLKENIQFKITTKFRFFILLIT